MNVVTKQTVNASVRAAAAKGGDVKNSAAAEAPKKTEAELKTEQIQLDVQIKAAEEANRATNEKLQSLYWKRQWLARQMQDYCEHQWKTIHYEYPNDPEMEKDPRTFCIRCNKEES